MEWHHRRLAAFDIETTGVDCERDRVVTAAVGLVGGGRPAQRRAWLVDPGVPIPDAAAAVHGVSTERARAEGRPPREAIEEVVTLLAEQLAWGVPVVAFNARFDLTTLDREALRHGVRPLADRVGPDGLLVVDPHVIDKQVDRFRRGKRTLSAVCAHYRVPLDDAHAADADALAAARIAWRLGQAHPELAAAELPALHRWQVAWAAEQAASLAEYLRANGRPEHVEPAWPIVPRPRVALAA